MPAESNFATLKNSLSERPFRPDSQKRIRNKIVPPVVKPKLLVTELWGAGDLAIATPFLSAAIRRFEIFLLAKPFALELQPRFWPEAHVIPFVAPWTAFREKYRLYRWPWKEMFDLRRRLKKENFQFALSARLGDPREHLLLKLSGAKERFGFPQLGSNVFLTHSLTDLGKRAHRYEFWRAAAKALEIELPPRRQITFQIPNARRQVLVHSGAGQPVRVWPLENYRKLIQRLRENGCSVQVICDVDQRDWWLQNNEPSVATPKTLTELIAFLDQAGVFIGNDSGPGHLAAISNVPTFTFFGPQLSECFAPIHPQAEWIDGLPCPYKPCRDYCRFPKPYCLWDITEESAWPRVEAFVLSHINSRTT